ANGIAEARAEIQRIKGALREGGVQVEDESNDDTRPQSELVQPPRTVGDVVSGDKILGDQRNIITGGGDYSAGNLDKRQGTFVEDKRLGIFIEALQPITSIQEQRNRTRMLQEVKLFWIEGVLDQSLYHAVHIDLDLIYNPGAVTPTFPW